jgi:DNA adenine methylase
MSKTGKLHFIRYPGGKQRITSQIVPYLPKNKLIKGRFVEPFLGGGAVFFLLEPQHAVLADINTELITLYNGIRLFPLEVWDIFRKFASTKEAYYQIRDAKIEREDIAYRAARTLYLNRTCFKGMWRHNSRGRFNVGYGGQSRRWVINETSLLEVSSRLQSVDLLCSDFQPVIETCGPDDFIFADPPYRPGERELLHSHYVYNKFSYVEHGRLASVLHQATEKGIKWALTVSSHPDILRLYEDNRIITLSRGTGRSPGILTDNPGEVLICNYHSEVAE